MAFNDVFDTIIDIMHHDYAGWEDKKGWGRPEFFREQLVKLEKDGLLTRKQFESVVNDYLLDYQDAHIALRSIKQEAPPQSVGFRVRHHEDKLYVEQIDQETRLVVGAIISEVDGMAVNSIAKINRRKLKSDIPEREWWEDVLLNATTITVEQNDRHHVYQLEQYDNPRKPSNYQFKKIENVGLFQFNDFINLEAMKDLLNIQKIEIDQCTQWIIDVRECRGGADSVYYPLFDGIFQPNPEIKSDGMVHLVTERNYENRMRSFRMFNNLEESPDPFLQAFIKQMDDNRGKGFVEFDFSEFEEEFTLKGSLKPTHVIILTEKFCGSSGEQFVLDASQSQKVTTIGRPTGGVLDYSNQAIEHFEEEGYDFFYPTSRSNRIEQGTGIDYKGITPDVYVKWTPEHLERDIDLEVALNVLNGNYQTN